MRELQGKDYAKHNPQIKAAAMNTLFAQAVLEQKAKGKVYLGGSEEAPFLYVVNSYGMALLYANGDKELDYEQLKPYLLNEDQQRSTYEWLQVYPLSLAKRLEEVLGIQLEQKAPDEPYDPSASGTVKKVIGYERMNYQFHIENYQSLQNNRNESLRIIRTSKEVYLNLKGNVIPTYFWESYEDFHQKGVGFTILSEKGEPLSTAFSAFVIDHQLEIGIETSAGSRGCGYATAVCMELIDYCIEHGYEPVWSCHSGNQGSRNLAKKLGFVVTKRLPYYRLPV